MGDRNQISLAKFLALCLLTGLTLSFCLSGVDGVLFSICLWLCFLFRRTGPMGGAILGALTTLMFLVLLLSQWQARMARAGADPHAYEIEIHGVCGDLVFACLVGAILGAAYGHWRRLTDGDNA